VPRSVRIGEPRHWLDGDFPGGTLRPGVPEGVAEVAEIARRLRTELDGRSISAVSREAGLTRSTIQDLISGRVVPDVVTLVKLERVLGVRLWPD
jgi:ribosome-binding protein aMBF1 (putative translation factor)